MQVERIVLGQLETVSGGRVSNTWVTYPGDWDNISKGVLIPGKTTPRERRGKTMASDLSYRAEMGPRPISLLAG